jgi:hypothetical protein
MIYANKKVGLSLYYFGNVSLTGESYRLSFFPTIPSWSPEKDGLRATNNNN